MTHSNDEWTSEFAKVVADVITVKTDNTLNNTPSVARNTTPSIQKFSQLQKLDNTELRDTDTDALKQQTYPSSEVYLDGTDNVYENSRNLISV